MTGITLSSAVRTNLNSLQATSDLMSTVQERLSTGKKVNSALDNPNSFFTAKGLENRASDLSTLLDDMGQSVQTLKAADQAISSISDLVDAAKAKANQALQTSSQSERKDFAAEYNELLTQIEDLAKDAGYGGKNLLGGSGNDLSVIFNEDGSSDLTISAVDYTDTTSSTGLNLSDLAAAADGTSTAAFTNGSAGATALASGATVVTDDDFTAGDTLTLSDSTGTELATLEITASTTVADVADFINDSNSDVSAATSAGGVDVTTSIDLSLSSDASGFTDISISAGTSNGFATDANIEATLTRLTSAQNTLRAQASTFGTNLSIVENRQDFTNALINTLEEGAGKLTLADTNEEGANLLALQTQQTLASTSLSLAAQADQNVLRLF
ncbi:flagellin [Roseibium sp. MMSF_3544]|uniref:flagellin N-terminal helical domain-containing protein n=1 Tax=unclassified Roseibium TaxID=2629323 RepID=UPI00273D881E|nr:flagellin [Roseibium sp. MMSF_3544]